ncbi:SgcJ/EcaC family oxidoreductase [uncultured Propionibacterium sp.]|uniref:SgcJ/EcaC family oxidoreductase n=1 Tax=uncultured Propionibacterium sp. TaxID=218066 RepID=UPI002930B2BE|nr:SgcJ/EcaC family oxidoreductase [uncultured Propionibacterium sp.]
MTASDADARARRRAVVQEYVDAMSAQDPDAVAALFAPDGTRTDPVGSPTLTGPERIRAALAEVMPGPEATVTMTFEELHFAGDSAAFVYDYRLSGPVRSRMRGIDVFAFDGQDRIRELVAYWSADDRVEEGA